MASDQYYKQFLQIQEKIFQVLRIKKKLEEKREFYIQKLSTNPINFNANDILSCLSSLVNLYEREEKVLAICEKGLENAREVE